MGFLDKIKSKGKGRDEDEGNADLPLNHVTALDGLMHRRTRKPLNPRSSPRPRPTMEFQAIVTRGHSPAESPTSPTPMPAVPPASSSAGTGLPIIGDQPVGASSGCSSRWCWALAGLLITATASQLLRHQGRRPGGCIRPGADAVAASGEVGVAGRADGHHDRVPGGEGITGGAGRATCAAWLPATAAVSGQGPGPRSDRSSTRCSRWWTRAEKNAKIVLGAAEDADAGRRQGAARDQPRSRRTCWRAPRRCPRCQAAAGRLRRAESRRRGPAGDADPAHRQVRQRIPDAWKA